METKVSVRNLQADFIKRIEALSGQNVYLCYQCGKCAAGCPMIDAMDILPNQIVRYIQLGLEKEVLNSKTIWLCASCFTCAIRCPRRIELASIMEAARTIYIRRNIDFIDISKIASTGIKFPQIALISCIRKFTG